MSEQIYSEEEIAQILRKAIELETERSTSGRKGSGKEKRSNIQKIVLRKSSKLMIPIVIDRKNPASTMNRAAVTD